MASGEDGHAAAAVSLELEPFLLSDFNHVEYSRSVVSEGNVETALEHLKGLSATVDQAIASHVSQHGHTLHSRLGHADALRTSLNSLKGCADTLTSSIGRAKRDVVEPFEALQQLTSELTNVITASDLIQRTGRFLQAAKKMRAHLDTSSTSAKSDSPSTALAKQVPTTARDLAKVSQILYELERLLEGGELDAIDAIQEERAWATALGSLVRSNAQIALHKAVFAFPNQTEVRSALQSFYFLHCLRPHVIEAATWAAHMAARDAREMLDVYELAQAVEQKNSAGGVPSSKSRISETLTAAEFGASPTIAGQYVDKQRKIGGGRTKVEPGTGKNSKEWIAELWSRVQVLENKLLLWCLRVWNLQRVLCKIPDPTAPSRTYNDLVVIESSSVDTQTGDFFDGQTQLHVYAHFWRAFLEQLGLQLQSVSKEKVSTFVKRALTTDYARLRRSLRRLLRRMSDSTSGKLIPAVGGSTAEREALMQTTQPFLRVYVASSWRLLDNFVDMMFKDGALVEGVGPAEARSLPTKADVNRFAEGIVNELVAAYDDTDLVVVLCGSSKTAIMKFAERAERLVVMDADASKFVLGDVSIPRTASQEHNAALLTLTLELYTKLGNLPLMMSRARKASSSARFASSETDVNIAIEKTLKAIKPAKDTLDGLCDVILGQYFGAAAEATEAVLARMHVENYAVNSSRSPGGSSIIVPNERLLMNEDPSTYIARFTVAVQALCERHLSLLPNHPIVFEARQVLLARVVVLFVRHLSMLRPLNETGRLKIARDMAEFELVVQPIAPHMPLKGVGVPYMELRAMRQLLFTDLAKVDDFLKLSVTIRKSLMWNHLFCTAPSELRSPHQQADMTATAYIQSWDRIELDTIGDGRVSGGSMGVLKCGTAWPGVSGGGGVDGSMREGKGEDEEDAAEAGAREAAAVAVEQQAWVRVEESLEAYRQRASAKQPTEETAAIVVDSSDPLAGLADSYHMCYALHNYHE